MQMSGTFLKCYPTVFVIGNKYRIAIFLKEKGLCKAKIGGEEYYEENAGVLSAEKCFIQISVPQTALDESEEYEIIYRKTIDKKAYFSEFGEEEKVKFVFRSAGKKEKLRAYHIADVHYDFENGKRLAEYYGNDTDLYIFNGDIGEVETEENYFEVLKFTGEISKGETPAVFVRGNHDTRGRLAERYCEYFPAIGTRTYYMFEIGNFRGVALDCGEDKVDGFQMKGGEFDGKFVYNGGNRFHEFRLKETKFLQQLRLPNDGKTVFCVSHICPNITTFHKGDCFDIEREEYGKWTKELERLNVRFMLSGHLHEAFVLLQNDERNTLPHKYPVIVGSENKDGKLLGTALEIDKGGITGAFTSADKNKHGTFRIDFKSRSKRLKKIYDKIKIFGCESFTF